MTYEICKPLHADVKTTCGYLCAMGTHGDLGNTLKWQPPFPDMSDIFKTHSKKSINDAVALINARVLNPALILGKETDMSKPGEQRVLM